MFTNKYPYTDFHEMNQDYILEQFAVFQGKLDGLKEEVYDQVMEDVQPQLDTLVRDFNLLYDQFTSFTATINSEIYQFEYRVQQQFIDLNAEFQRFKDQIAVQIEQVKLYSDINDETLYNKIVDDISSGVISTGETKVINYITGQIMTVQDMFNYLCMFHLTNPISYTQLALKNISYAALAALNITYTDLIVNGNILIP